jgi:hypothetical protein
MTCIAYELMLKSPYNMCESKDENIFDFAT